MAWRIAKALSVYLAEVNTIWPARNKGTDGSISGYTYGAGGVVVNGNNQSSHNINSAGVVCAFDVTTGAYAGGISHLDGQLLAEVTRRRLRDQPRGVPAYIIHYMDPPFVAASGPYIAHGNWDWSWSPYTGPDLHTSHAHLSVDKDIFPGGAPSEDVDYDTDLPWDLAAGLVEVCREYGFTLEDGIVPGSENDEEDEDMAFTDEDRALLKETRDRTLGILVQRYDGDGSPARVLDNLDGGYLLAVLGAKVDALTSALGQVAGGGSVDLGAVTAAAEAGAQKALDSLRIVSVENGKANG